VRLQSACPSQRISADQALALRAATLFSSAGACRLRCVCRARHHLLGCFVLLVRLHRGLTVAVGCLLRHGSFLDFCNCGTKVDVSATMRQGERLVPESFQLRGDDAHVVRFALDARDRTSAMHRCARSEATSLVCLLSPTEMLQLRFAHALARATTFLFLTPTHQRVSVADQPNIPPSRNALATSTCIDTTRWPYQHATRANRWPPRREETSSRFSCTRWHVQPVTHTHSHQPTCCLLAVHNHLTLWVVCSKRDELASSALDVSRVGDVEEQRVATLSRLWQAPPSHHVDLQLSPSPLSPTCVWYESTLVPPSHTPTESQQVLTSVCAPLARNTRGLK
jgi:hypothetical protein